MEEKVKTIATIISVLLCTSFLVQAQKQPDQTRMTAWENFRTEEGEEWTIRWNEKTGLPRTMLGVTNKSYEGDPETIACTFLSENQQLLNTKNQLTDLQHVKTQTHRGVHYVTLQQYYKEIPVNGAEYVIHVHESGQVGMVTGFYYPDIDISISPSVTASSALSLAKTNLNIVNPIQDKSTTNLVVYPENDKYTFVYKVRVNTENPYHDMEYIIDANNGAVLSKTDKAKNFGHFTSETTSGTGRVYPKHPLNSTLTDVSLNGLAYNGRLDGTYTKIKNKKFSTAYEVYNSFIYSPTSTHFVEVSLYYHIDTFRRNFIEPLDVNNNLFTKIEATAHNDNSYCKDNACFQAGPFALFFSDTYPFAKEDKVVYHEYSHAVIYDIESGIESEKNEEGAISEGLPDYFAGAATPTKRDSSGESLGKTSFERSLVTPEINTYSEYTTILNSQGSVNQYDGGEFFASILWEIRNDPRISGTNADELVYDAIYGVSGNPDFLEFRDAMMAADLASNQGYHRHIIQDLFAAKGVGIPSALNVSISGPINMDEGTSET